jgi:hypothetical protein
MHCPHLTAVAVVVMVSLAVLTVGGATALEISDDLRLTGEYHGAYFRPAHGWVFAKVDFGDGSLDQLSFQVAVSQTEYNLTCGREAYRVVAAGGSLASLPASAKALAAANEDAASSKAHATLAGLKGSVVASDDGETTLVAIDLKNVVHRRGCLVHRVRDGDYSGIVVAADVPTSPPPGERTVVRPAQLYMDVQGLESPLPASLPLVLVASAKAPRSEADLSQHFPPHKRRGAPRYDTKLGLRPDRRDEL